MAGDDEDNDYLQSLEDPSRSIAAQRLVAIAQLLEIAPGTETQYIPINFEIAGVSITGVTLEYALGTNNLLCLCPYPPNSLTRRPHALNAAIAVVLVSNPENSITIGVGTESVTLGTGPNISIGSEVPHNETQRIFDLIASIQNGISNGTILSCPVSKMTRPSEN